MHETSEPRRPPFASDFPAVEEVDRLVLAFSRGDYARVRQEARLLLDTGDTEVQRAARELLVRSKPDPLAVWLLILSALLVLGLSAWWVAYGRVS